MKLTSQSSLLIKESEPLGQNRHSVEKGLSGPPSLPSARHFDTFV